MLLQVPGSFLNIDIDRMVSPIKIARIEESFTNMFHIVRPNGVGKDWEEIVDSRG